MSNTKEYYYTIHKAGVAEFKDRGSRFIALAFPVQHIDDVKSILQQVKKEHPKAVHHCFAYRIGLSMDQFRVSDDGEPSGTAGRPILGQIDSRQLTNTLLVVVRYFGGILLGVSGLIIAYKTSASLVLQTIPVVKEPVRMMYSIQFDYTQLNDIHRALKKWDVLVKQQSISLFPKIEVSIPIAQVNRLEAYLQTLPNVLFEKLI